MFVASRRIALFDRYRVPYTVDSATGDGSAVRIARADGRGAELLSVPPALDAPARPFVIEGAFLHAPLADTDAAARAGGAQRQWSDETPIVDEFGVTRSAVRRGADGSVLLPFDLPPTVAVRAVNRSVVPTVIDRTAVIAAVVVAISVNGDSW